MRASRLAERRVLFSRFLLDDVHFEVVRLPACKTGDFHDPFSLSPPFSKVDDRPFREHVWHRRRLDVVDVQAVERNLLISQNRGLDVFPESSGLFFGVCFVQ